MLLIALVFFCIVLLLPGLRLHLGRALFFGLFSPHSGKFRGAPSNDILKYIDPLIGTVNGGLSSKISFFFSEVWPNILQAMYSQELRCRTVSSNQD